MTAAGITTEPPSRFGRLTTCLARMPILLSDRSLILRMSDAADERVLACYGQLEIHQRDGGLSAQTRVKGEQDQALVTALQRLRQFLLKNYRSGLDIRLRRPLVQFEEVPGRWVVRMNLLGARNGVLSPASRGGRVRVIPLEAQTVGVLPVHGQPTIRAIEEGAERMRNLLVSTPWLALGDPAIRLEAPLSRLPFMTHFELELPVSRRSSDLGESPNGMELLPPALADDCFGDNAPTSPLT
jgi:hypothetical protein